MKVNQVRAAGVKYVENDQKYKSISITKEPVDMSISDITSMLKSEVKKHANLLDAGTADMILEADEDVLDLLLAEYDSQLLWNLTNTTLGKGILIGLVFCSITDYYEALRKAESDDEDDDSISYRESNEDDGYWS